MFHRLPERGRITGTRAGTAVGQGVVEIAGVVNVLAEAGYRGVLSVECHDWEQARVSKVRLDEMIAQTRKRTKAAKTE